MCKILLVRSSAAISWMDFTSARESGILRLICVSPCNVEFAEEAVDYHVRTGRAGHKERGFGHPE
jgi:hypothetical protein